MPTRPDKKKRLLVVRFSSFGDICQSLFAVEALLPYYQMDFLTRSDFRAYVEQFGGIDQVFGLQKKQGLKGLLRLAWRLRQENYDIVYDAHSNLRSHIFGFILTFLKPTRLVRRSKERLRFWLLFRFRANTLNWPYRGGDSYVRPIRHLLPKGRENIEPLKFPIAPIGPEAEAHRPFYLLAPFASWPTKVLPESQWRVFLQSHLDKKFVIVGGPDDRFPQSLLDEFSSQLLDLTGKANWVETLSLVSQAKAVIGVDTGITHIADLIGKPAHFFIGPSAIGYPTRPTSQIHEIELACKPCSKDGRKACTNETYLKCLRDIPLREIQL